MTEQPTALRLAEYWAAKNDQGEYLYSSLRFREETAAELRRLHEEITALRAALAAVRFQCEADSKAGEWATPISRVLDAIEKAEEKL